ncbi:MAG: hypothetical protein ABIO60_10715 [Aquaticitalea sp.]
MKLKSIISAIIMVATLCSCGAKKAVVNKEELKKEAISYISNVDNNNNLKKEVIEGALTDSEGFKDIGTFKYTVYFDVNSNKLFKIKNVEMTDKTITESYYFQDNELVYLKSVSGNDTKTIYLKKGRVVSETNTTSDDQQVLLAKAKRFQNAFEKSH